jgi:hypothetical protein
MPIQGDRKVARTIARHAVQISSLFLKFAQVFEKR